MDSAGPQAWQQYATCSNTIDVQYMLDDVPSVHKLWAMVAQRHYDLLLAHGQELVLRAIAFSAS